MARKAITRTNKSGGPSAPSTTVEDYRSERPDLLTVDRALDRLMRIYEAESYRPKTIAGYRSHFAEFADIVRRQYLADVTEDDFRRYIAHMLNVRELSPVTINIRLASVRAMFNRLYNEGLLTRNPGERIRKLKTDEGRIFNLSDNQVRRLFSVLDVESFPQYRDYVAMLTMLKCGLRSNEITALEPRDIDFDNNVIILPGAKNKSRRTRMVPMTPKVRSEIAELTSMVREAFGDVERVFTNQFGEELRFDLIRKRMQKYSERAGLTNEVRASPHSLRHTFAVNYLRNGGDIRSLQMILGHADLSTTQKYLDYADDVIIEKYNEASKNDKLDV